MTATGVLPVVPAVLLVLLCYALLFGSAELLRRRGVGAETTRRLVHVVGSLLALPLPILVGVRPGVVMAVGLAGLLALSRRRGVLGSVNDVERTTVGAVVFPLGIALVAVVASDYAQYCFGVLVLGFADAAAGWVGARTGHPLRGWPTSKSVAGSTAFFVVTLTLAVAFRIALGGDLTLVLVPSALAVTVVEALLARGWDDLAVPSAAALAFAWMF
jgi:dolichol kinase